MKWELSGVEAWGWSAEWPIAKMLLGMGMGMGIAQGRGRRTTTGLLDDLSPLDGGDLGSGHFGSWF